SFAFRVDTTAPSRPTVTGVPNGWTRAHTNTATAHSADAGGIGKYQHQVSTNLGTTWSAVATGQTVTVTTEGATMIRFRAIDKLSHVSAWSPVAEIDHDWTPPAAPDVTGGVSDWVDQPSVEFTFAAADPTSPTGPSDTDNVASFLWETSVDGGTTWSAPNTSQVTNVNES